MDILTLNNVSKVYGELKALDSVNLSVAEGEWISIMGPSGSGKTTMMNIIGCMDKPSFGKIELAGRDISKLTNKELTVVRRDTIGLVFQQFHLSPGVTALDNVADGLLYRGVPRAKRREKAREALEKVGLGHRIEHRPHQMSGGERQRVAIARALVGSPALLLADEPTGNLDSRSGEAIVSLLRELNDSGTTIIVITHDNDLAASLPRQVMIRDGKVVSDSASEVSQ